MEYKRSEAPKTQGFYEPHLIQLAAQCLALREMEAEKELEGKPEEEKIRMLLACRDDQVPVYVVGQGKTVRKRGERLEVWSYEEGKISEARIREISKICLYRGVEITTPAMVELMQRNVPVLHFSHGGWFQGICLGMSHKNVLLRIKQFQGQEMRRSRYPLPERSYPEIQIYFYLTSASRSSYRPAAGNTLPRALANSSRRTGLLM